MSDRRQVTVKDLKQCADTILSELKHDSPIYVGERRPRAVIVSARAYEALLDYVEDLEDQLAYFEFKRTDPQSYLPFDSNKRKRIASRV